MTDNPHDDRGQQPLPHTVLHQDEVGMPCFDCYFKALYQAAPDDMLAVLAAEPSTVPPEDVEHGDRIALTMAYLADSIGATLVYLYDDPEPSMDLFFRMLRDAVAQAQVEQEQD
jgi:hypothetical protein